MYLIFDFDGTLVDSFYCAIETFNSLADDFNFRKINLEEIDSLKNLSSKELIEYLKIPLYKIPAVLYRARKCIQEKMQTLAPFVGMAEILRHLSNAGFTLGIVTSNSEENVLSWLHHYGIKQYFNFIHIESSYFGKSSVLRKVMKMNKIENTQAFYIGDETRDIEAAKQCGMTSIAVTWGFNSETILLKSRPDYLAHLPEDLLKIGLARSNQQ